MNSIDISRIYDELLASFTESAKYFIWEESRLIRTSLKRLPAPEAIKDLPTGTFFALVNIGLVIPDEELKTGFLEAKYTYTIFICRKGYDGTVSRLRSDMIKEFMAGWFRYWGNRSAYLVTAPSITPQADDLEMYYPDIMAVQVDGTISEIVSKGNGIING